MTTPDLQITPLEFMDLSVFNPLYSDGFSLPYKSNKNGIVLYIF